MLLVVEASNVKNRPAGFLIVLQVFFTALLKKKPPCSCFSQSCRNFDRPADFFAVLLKSIPSCRSFHRPARIFLVLLKGKPSC